METPVRPPTPPPREPTPVKEKSETISDPSFVDLDELTESDEYFEEEESESEYESE